MKTRGLLFGRISLGIGATVAALVDWAAAGALLIVIAAALDRA